MRVSTVSLTILQTAAVLANNAVFSGYPQTCQLCLDGVVKLCSTASDLGTCFCNGAQSDALFGQVGTCQSAPSPGCAGSSSILVDYFNYCCPRLSANATKCASYYATASFTTTSLAATSSVTLFAKITSSGNSSSTTLRASSNSTALATTSRTPVATSSKSATSASSTAGGNMIMADAMLILAPVIGFGAML